MIGSCDAELFRAHYCANDFRYAGTGAAATDALELFKINGSALTYRRSKRAGEVWAWTYAPIVNYGPEIWGIVQADGTPRIVWEAESRIGIEVDANPMALTGPTGSSILLAGETALRFTLPLYDELETIAAAISAASLPSWITGTVYETAADADELATTLFLEAQGERGMRIFADIESPILREDLEYEEKEAYKLLYLRAASRTLENHAGETAIPLIENRFTVDVITGEMTAV